MALGASLAAFFLFLLLPLLAVLAPIELGSRLIQNIFSVRPGSQAVLKTYLPLEEQAVAAQHGAVSLAWVQAVMMQESGGNPAAVSSTGCIGLMQLCGDKTGKASPFDPRANVLGGTAYLAGLARMFHGNIPLATAAYNAGPGVVKDWIATYHTSDWSVLSQEPGVVAFAGGQTWNYVESVLGYMQEFQTTKGEGNGAANPGARPGRGGSGTASRSVRVPARHP